MHKADVNAKTQRINTQKLHKLKKAITVNKRTLNKPIIPA